MPIETDPQPFLFRRQAVILRPGRGSLDAR